MTTIQQQTGGRVIARFPCDPGEPWYDWQGVSHPAPLRPLNLQHIRLPFEVELNCGRMFCTSHRGCVERAFLQDWAKKILGSLKPIPHQYLEQYNKQPTPQVSQLYVLLMVNMAVDVSHSHLSFILCLTNLGSVCNTFQRDRGVQHG